MPKIVKLIPLSAPHKVVKPKCDQGKTEPIDLFLDNKRPVVVAGRNDVCGFQIADGLASKYHTVFALVNNQLVVIDTGSSNRVRLNGHVIDQWTPLDVKEGDKLQIGKGKFRVLITDELSPEELARSRQATVDPGDLPPLPVDDSPKL